MTECKECEGGLLKCIDKDGRINECERCGCRFDEWGKIIGQTEEEWYDDSMREIERMGGG